MNQLGEFLPLALYAAAYAAADIYTATWVLIAATAAHVAWAYASTRRVPRMVWINAVAAAVFGGMTLASQDVSYLVMRATALYWLLAVGLYVAYRFTGRNALQILLERHFDAPDRIWQRSLWGYVAFFAVLGVANVAVAFAASEAAWVAFDTFGALAIIALFMVAHLLSMRAYVKGPSAT